MTLQCMAILNITPDSFSDGGRYFGTAAIRAQLQHLSAWPGPLVIDIGFESTAPMNGPISSEEEIRRFQDLLWPVLSTLKLEPQIQLSFDTYKCDTFFAIYQTLRQHHIRAPLIWNDVSGKFDQKVITFLQEHSDCRYIFCHNLVATRAQSGRHMEAVNPTLTGPALRNHMIRYFQDTYEQATQAAIVPQLIFDPCFGFSKTRAQNEQLLTDLATLIPHFPKDLPWVIGLSRKSFLRRLVRETGRPLNTPAEFERSDLLQILLLNKIWQELPDFSLLYRLHNCEHFAALLEARERFAAPFPPLEKEL